MAEDTYKIQFSINPDLNFTNFIISKGLFETGWKINEDLFIGWITDNIKTELSDFFECITGLPEIDHDSDFLLQYKYRWIIKPLRPSNCISQEEAAIKLISRNQKPLIYMKRLKEEILQEAPYHKSVIE